jgi:hypothetical protein
MAKKVASAERIAVMFALAYLKAESSEERSRIAELAAGVGSEIVGSASEFMARIIQLCNEALAEAQKG